MIPRHSGENGYKICGFPAYIEIKYMRETAMAEKRKWNDKFKLAMGELEYKIQRERRGRMQGAGPSRKRWRHGTRSDSGREGAGSIAAL